MDHLPADVLQFKNAQLLIHPMIIIKPSRYRPSKVVNNSQVTPSVAISGGLSKDASISLLRPRDPIRDLKERGLRGVLQ
jgi:hypothetical protein